MSRGGRGFLPFWGLTDLCVCALVLLMTPDPTRTGRGALSAPGAPVGGALLLAVLAAAVLLLVGGGQAQAAGTIMVDTLDGAAVDGKCSLGEAIEAADTDKAVDACPAGSGDDAINIAVAGVIRAPRDGFRVSSNVVVQGNARGTTIDGRGAFGSDAALRITLSHASKSIVDATAVTLADLTIYGVSDGVSVSDDDRKRLGAPYSVTLENLHISDSRNGVDITSINSARPGEVIVKDSVIRDNSGRGISHDDFWSRTSLKIVNSVIRDNDIGVYRTGSGDSKLVDSTVTGSRLEGVYVCFRWNFRGESPRFDVTNSTIVSNGNRSDGRGGIRSCGHSMRGDLSIVNSTIADNTAMPGLAEGVNAPGYTRTWITNSVITGDGDGQCRFRRYALTNIGSASRRYRVVSVGSVSSDSSCGSAHETVDPRLGPLRDNGGAVPIGPNGGLGNVLTMAIDATSPLFDAGDGGACPDEDARGVARLQGPGCDIGAYEAEEAEGVFAVGDLIWEDLDGDDGRDDGEPGIGGVTVALVNSAGDVEATDTTDEHGGYGFRVAAGKWTVRVTDTAGVLTGYRPPVETSVSAGVTAAGGANLGFDFGYRRRSAAGTITVDTLDGAAVDGKCSLGEAIEAANTDKTVDACPAGVGDDTINISKPGDITAPTDGFRITSNVRVQGHADGTTVSGGGGFDVVVTRVWPHEAPPATYVKLADLTVTGSSEYGVAVTDYGNSAYTRHAESTEYTVMLENLHIEESVYDGVRIVRATNSSRPGRVHIVDSVVKGNSWYGVYLESCDVKPADVKLLITNSVISGNSPGGVYNRCGSLRLDRSSVSGNSGRGAYSYYGDFDYDYRKAGWSGGNGPGTEIINTTVADNESRGVVVSQAGGIRPGLSIVSSTITANTDPDSLSAGVLTVGAVNVSVDNTVVAGNSGPQCRFASASMIDPGNADSGNASSDESCGFALKNVRSGLEELADNGGADGIGPNGGMGHVLTMAIKASSPLLDAGDGAACPEKDARGVARPQGPGCDIGAYEAEDVEAEEVFAVGDLVWEDLNGDGDQNDGEPGIAGVTVKLTGGGVPARTDTTDEHGGYDFRVTAGKWTVRVTDTTGVLTGHQPVAGTSKTADVAVDGGANLAFDFGYRRPKTVPPKTVPPTTVPPTTVPPATSPPKAPVGSPPPLPSGSIRNLVWVDSDGDGVKGEGESGLKGVRAVLRRDGSEVGSASTDKSGVYSFTGLAAGVYVVEVEAPAGLEFASGSSGGVNSVDPDRRSVWAVRVSLGEGEEKVPPDVGLRRVRVDGPLVRYEGVDRYGTGVDISKRTAPPGVDVVYVATGENFPDALAGSAASGGRGPILLVTRKVIPDAVVSELKRLKPGRVVVLAVLRWCRRRLRRL